MMQPKCGMWCIQGTVKTMTKDGGEINAQFPTFYIHPEVQGCSNEQAAVRVATGILNPTNDGNIWPNPYAVLVSVEAVADWTADEVAAMKPELNTRHVVATHKHGRLI
jgi:hypothetical protein